MKVRVVGTGSIGSRYLRILADMHAHGHIPERPRAVSIRGVLGDRELQDHVTVETDPVELLPDVDLTIIATRTARHVPDAEAYGQSTRRMLVEKPVAATFTEASTLAPLASRVPMAVCAPLRFMEGFAATRKALPDIGAVTNVEVRCQSWLPDWRPGTDYRSSYSADPEQGGVLRDLVHEIDVAITLFGLPRSVAASLTCDPELGIDVETSARMTWNYDAFSLTMVLDYVSRVPIRTLTAHGTVGRVHWDVLEGTLKTESRGVETSQTWADDVDRNRVLARQVLAAAASAGTPQSRACARLADGMRALAICELAKTSAARGGEPAPVFIDGTGP